MPRKARTREVCQPLSELTHVQGAREATSIEAGVDQTRSQGLELEDVPALAPAPPGNPPGRARQDLLCLVRGHDQSHLLENLPEGRKASPRGHAAAGEGNDPTEALPQNADVHPPRSAELEAVHEKCVCLKSEGATGEARQNRAPKWGGG